MKFLILLILLSQHAFASFDNTSYRYLMPNDLSNKIMTLFTTLNEVEESTDNQGNKISKLKSYTCAKGWSKDRLPTLGTSSPITGDAQTPTPDFSTVNEILECARSAAYIEFNLLYKRTNLVTPLDGQLPKESLQAASIIEKFFPVYQKLTQKSPNDFYNNFYRNIKAEDPQVLLQHTIHLVQLVLGPDQVIAEYGQAENAHEIAQDLMQEKIQDPNTIALYEYTQWVLMNLVVREEFLAF